MKKAQIVKAEEWHIEPIVLQMREPDVAELASLG
jgi:hypothetical protein